jgi:guanine deaminase
MRPEDFMRQAIRLSLENLEQNRGGPFAAVVAKDGRVLASGTNLVTSTNDPTAHAEMVAIREACKSLGTFQLEGCELYTTCEPCPMCMGAIFWARPTKVYYANTRDDAARIGFDDAAIYHELSLALDRRSIPMVQLLHDEAYVAFDAWMRNEARIRY